MTHRIAWYLALILNTQPISKSTFCSPTQIVKDSVAQAPTAIDEFFRVAQDDSSFCGDQNHQQFRTRHLGISALCGVLMNAPVPFSSNSRFKVFSWPNEWRCD